MWNKKLDYRNMSFPSLLPWRSEVVYNLLSLGKDFTLLLHRGATQSLDPPLGNLSFAISLGIITFLITLSFRGVNLPLGEKALFLEEHSLNLPVSFSLRVVNLPHGEVVTPRNLYRYKLRKIIMTGICIGISYGK